MTTTNTEAKRAKSESENGLAKIAISKEADRALVEIQNRVVDPFRPETWTAICPEGAIR